MSTIVKALRTLGDKDQSTALYNFGAKSLWTTELEEKLTSGQLDVIVHCLKDPTARRGGRHLRFANLRGNVKRRLAKVDKPESEYTCMIMSAAGLERVGLKRRITQHLGSKDGGILHAVGQGALGLEIRKGDAAVLELLNQLVDRKSALACLAERALMRTLEGGCSVPIGVETEWLDPQRDSVLRMRAIVRSGKKSMMAASLVEAGADANLKNINTHRPSKD
ncbi:putative porphobilinogen deaminase [Diaporthe ampelina]|uniref:hydroxymethylbilane synthase n=1 Tax=Diaporthe ampelina TaxID=1214573 RepID=A0A0G2H825_9PEZI|nr:putative porphobilinogen deaminase [Diaporthe ampelina]